MTHQIQQTSLEAFKEIKTELGSRQKQVYEALRELGEANNREIAEYLERPINSITPRNQELRDKKLVGVAYEGKDQKTGKTTIYWKCVK